MENKPTIAELLAFRDSEPVAAELEARIERDVEARDRLAILREIKAALGGLPNELGPDPDHWEKIQLEHERRSFRLRGSRQSAWPMALVASALIIAMALLIRPSLEDDATDLSLARLAVLQDRSRALEAELMSASRHAGTPSEQALFFRLADVDAQLSDVDGGDSLSLIQQRELLWQRRVELMEALQAVQRPLDPRPQYAVY